MVFTPSLKSFVKGVSALTTGTALAQLILLLVSPILTRIYSPSDFGDLAIFLSILSVISVFVCGRYELAIVLPKNVEEAINVLGLSFFLTVLRLSCFGVVSFVDRNHLVS